MDSATPGVEVELRVSRNTGLVVVLGVLILVGMEATLQARSHLRTGQSVVSVISGRTTFARDPETGLRLLRPSSIVQGQRSRMQTNRYGLRGADFEPTPRPGERRIAVLGSSTIMGTYASSDAMKDENRANGKIVIEVD